MSNDSLIGVCNRVLLNCGERPIVNTNNTTGIRVKSALRTAYTDVQTLYDWSWNRKEVTASSWSGALATIDDMQRLKGVIYRGVNNYNRVLLPSPYSSLVRKVSGVGVPRSFALVNDRQVLVFPYPSTVVEQGRVIFQIVSWVNIPINDQDTFSVLPDAFVDLLVERASAIFASTHNNDVGLMQTFNNNYETLAQRLRDRYRNVSTDGLSMYRGLR